MTSACTRRRPADLALALALTLTVGPALALESDRDQPMEIEAVDSESDLKTGSTTLIGKVQIRQGSLLIQAERGEVHQSSQTNEVAKVVLEGSPAWLEQALDNAAGHMKASANRIEYDRAANTAVLTGAVRIEEPRGTLTGERVTYDIAKGNVQGSSNGGDGRVRFVIPPRPKATDSDNN